MARSEEDVYVPFLDLSWQTEIIRSELIAGWDKILTNSDFILSDVLAEFEKAFSEFSEVQFTAGVANGTDALEIGLRALGIGLGDEVIVPANSFVASAIAVTRTGATPVLVDCLEQSSLMDPDFVSTAVTGQTKAIMPVHLYGQMADMAALEEIASRHGPFLIEDVAQAQGAEQHGRKAGSIGHVAATSFYPGKNLGALGDAGAVMTSSPQVFEKVLSLRNYGSPVKYSHPEFGFNSRLDSIQAVALIAKLKRLATWNKMRNKQAKYYLESLSDVPEIGLPAVVDGNLHVWHLFVITVDKRSQVEKFLNDAGIRTGIHYPNPIHLLGMYEGLGYREGDFPNSERLSQRALSLPLYPGLSEEQQDYVVTALKKAIVAEP